MTCDDEDESPDELDTGWYPDHQLVPAMLAGTCTATRATLDSADVAWVVVNLRQTNRTAKAIAAYLDCDIRQVRAVAAGAAGRIMARYLSDTEHFADEHQMLSGEVRRLDTELTAALAEATRYKTQLDRLLGVHLAEKAGKTHRCGCPMTKYNTYVRPSGYVDCREHRRQAVARHRQSKRQTGMTTAITS